MSESWSREACDHCQALNWICDGDLEDQTVPTIEGVCCYACNRIFLRCERLELIDMYGEVYPDDETLEDQVYAVCGRKNPDDPHRPLPNLRDLKLQMEKSAKDHIDMRLQDAFKDKRIVLDEMYYGLFDKLISDYSALGWCVEEFFIPGNQFDPDCKGLRFTKS